MLLCYERAAVQGQAGSETGAQQRSRKQEAGCDSDCVPIYSMLCVIDRQTTDF